MATEDKCDSNARAYPRGDGDKNHRSQPALSNKLRLGTWNLGTMTGRSAELSQILHNRNINICCIQETKWKGSKSREIGHGFQLVYHGVDTKRNGVGIILDQNLKHRIVGVERKSDRLIAIKLAMDDQPILNIVSAYAPQVGCPALEKEAFWEDFDEILQSIPAEECIHIGAYLNGHVGARPLECIHPMKIKLAIRKMEHNKALGPDNVPVDIWKLLGEDALPWLTSLFNKIAFEGKIPASWRLSYLCPLFKNVAQCNNYRGIKLMSHTLKLWERVIGARLTALTKPTANQFGFTTGRSTIEAIQTIRILMEKHRVNKENLYLVFIDLEKAFDKVPRELVWQALRAQEIPEAYITLIQDMYDDVSTQIKSPAGISDPFYVRVGVHQADDSDKSKCD
ncbi:hypothetical protein MSG28_016030 [Choristoneura fumiferana]|uniref:Uncharacterized protein n=1 Tax=Choristoneura fumiferana TaxID=7141 RepID=A0ACC0K5J9_CHOFU|nr:hypothetical protein MSG28_016030 [Choristoneura fumiferana]